jgi:hypothetical protein
MVAFGYMEPIIVMVHYEGLAPIKKYGAYYQRANGQRKIITTGQRASGMAKEKAERAVIECEWEPFVHRKDGILDVGYAWLDAPVSD